LFKKPQLDFSSLGKPSYNADVANYPFLHRSAFLVRCRDGPLLQDMRAATCKVFQR
jgi:hypothetical protein